jgi:tricorn protease-like protein
MGSEDLRSSAEFPKYLKIVDSFGLLVTLDMENKQKQEITAEINNINVNFDQVCYKKLLKIGEIFSFQPNQSASQRQ